MAAKLIMKRKRHQDMHLMENEAETPTKSNAVEDLNDDQQKRRRKQRESQTTETAAKVSEYQDAAPPYAINTTTPPSVHNHLLMDALQKIIELQQELDAFEHDLDESDYNDDAEVSYYLEHEDLHQQARAQVQRDSDEYRRHEAEALGFAMCARETMLFLQREGISSESLLYRSLHQRLVCQNDDVIPI